MILHKQAAAWLRNAPWLDADRATAYARVLAILMAVGLAYGWSSDGLGHHPFAPPPSGAAPGRPQPEDFVAFWSAGRLAIGGRPQAGYDITALSGVERQATNLDRSALLPFLYPPTFLLLCLPFALLPYLAGFIAFAGLQMAALMAVLRQLQPPAWGWLPVFAFPGFLVNAATGQNGCLSAICFATGACLLKARPFMAGVCFGGLAFKPHLALCVPVVLIAARRWRALAGGAVGSLGFVGVSLAVFGTPTWIEFLLHAPLARVALENHPEEWGRLQSVFAAMRILSLPQWAAYAAQALLAASVAVAVAVIGWRRPGGDAEAVLVSAAAVLCTPYVLDYDLALTGVPLAWIARRAEQSGWWPWEKLACATVFLWPLVARAAGGAGLPFGPVLLVALFALVARRAWATHI